MFFVRFCPSLISRLALVLVVTLIGRSAFSQDTGHGIAAGMINVVQNDTNNTVDSVDVSTAISINDFQIRDGSNRGDYFLQIGDGFSDDFAGGIVMACIAQNGRDNSEGTGSNFLYGNHRFSDWRLARGVLCFFVQRALRSGVQHQYGGRLFSLFEIPRRTSLQLGCNKWRG